MQKYIIKIAGLFSVIAILAMPQLASAAGTLAGTTVTNLATLSFSLGGIPQTPIPSDDNVTTDFRVDRVVDVAVVSVDAATVKVVPGGPGVGNYYVQEFTVTNNGNGTDTFDLIIANSGDFALTTTPLIYIDTNGSGTFEIANDTAVTDTGALLQDIGDTYFIVSAALANEVPLAQANGDLATYTLTATTQLTASSGGGLAVVDIIFIDDAGGTGANAGDDSDVESFEVQAGVTVGKTVAVNGGGEAIPGATVTYTITIANATGSPAAILSQIGDPLFADLSIVATAAAATWSLGDGVNTDNGTLTADATPADGLDYNNTTAGSVVYLIQNFLITANTGNNGARSAPGELQGGETLTLTFQATIN